MRRHWLVLPLLAVLLAACGAPTGGAPTPTPLLPQEDATALGQAPAAIGAPTSTPLLPQEAATASAQALGQAPAGLDDQPAQPTPPSASDPRRATALAADRLGPSATPTAFGEGGGIPATRTPVVGIPQVLPAPLYLRSQFLDRVLRVERDTANYRELTFERYPVVELAVPVRAGGLFYVTGPNPNGEMTLVALGGTGRRELLTGKISDLVVTPDGDQLYFRLEDPQPGLIVGQDASPTGVWTTWPEGGRPGLVIADVPADGTLDADAPAWTYTPLAPSPDGGRLALFAYDEDGPGIPGGELVILDRAGQGQPVRVPTCCEAPVWSADGASLLVAGGGPAPDTRYGLYRIDAATGAETPILTGEGDDTVPLVTAPFEAPGGQVFAFVELAPADGFSWEYPFQPALARVEAGGAVTPLAPPTTPPLEVLWAEGARGALLRVADEDPAQPSPLLWQPADGSPAITTAFEGDDLAWVPANGPLEAGDCAAFTPLTYQEGAARQADPAVADVQSRLLALGFDGGLPDGLYGPQTRAAVEAFQQARGLPVTGDVGCATWQALLAQP